MITLTERAKKYLNSIDRDSSNHVSLSVKGGGCSGFQYVWGMKMTIQKSIGQTPLMIF